jgi:hypothetical protein
VILAAATAATRTPFGPLVLLCTGLVCLFLVSGIALAVVLYRQSRRRPPDDVS